jgi:spore coat polysaccharide biosynthesis protein SpsF
MRTVMIVQARMTSTRLPGKVMKEVLGKPLLEYQIERLRRVKLIDTAVIACTVNPADEAIVALCERLPIPFFRGPEEDVLSRYHGAAAVQHADAIVRVTSDCPIIDPMVIDQTIQYYLDGHGQLDYVTNAFERSYPLGMDTEILSFRALHEAFLEARDPLEREHVTAFIYRRPQRYRLANLTLTPSEAHHRWTVDTAEDFELISRIIGALYPRKSDFSMGDVLDLLRDHPQWMQINAGVRQREVTR